MTKKRRARKAKQKQVHQNKDRVKVVVCRKFSDDPDNISPGRLVAWGESKTPCL